MSDSPSRVGPWRRTAPNAQDGSSKRHYSPQRHNLPQRHESPCEIIVISHHRHLQNTDFPTIPFSGHAEIRKLTLSSIPAFGRALLQGRTRLTIVVYRRETG